MPKFSVRRQEFFCSDPCSHRKNVCMTNYFRFPVALLRNIYYNLEKPHITDTPHFIKGR